MILDWDDYISVRKSGIKVRWKPLLEERIKYIFSLNKEEKNKYLANLCHYYFDLGKIELPIQHPQIWNAILEIWRENLIWDDEKMLLWLVKALAFKDAYFLLYKDSRDILRRIIELNPINSEAKKLLFDEYLQILDFAMHSIDSGMLIEKAVGEKVIVECETLLNSEPSLKNYKSRFGGSFEYYKSRFLLWYKYSKEDTNLNFDDWYIKKMQ